MVLCIENWSVYSGGKTFSRQHCGLHIGSIVPETIGPLGRVNVVMKYIRSQNPLLSYRPNCKLPVRTYSLRCNERLQILGENFD